MYLARCTLIERATIFDGQIEEYEWVMVQIEHVEIINNWNVELKKKLEISNILRGSMIIMSNLILSQ